MGPPEMAERRPRQETAPQIASDQEDRYGNGTPDAGECETDLFGEPVETEPELPRRATWDDVRRYLTMDLPHGWRFSSLAPLMKRMPPDVESIWVTDQEGEFRHLFVDRRTGRERHYDVVSQRWY